VSFDDTSDDQQWFEELEDYLVRKAEESAAALEGGEEDFLEHLREEGIELSETEPDEPDEELAEAIGEFTDEEDAVNIFDLESDPHDAPDNQADDSWERVYHFDFGIEARNFLASVAVGPLWIIYNEDGSADVFVDRDYEGATV
jgi:hypothetical protein